MRFTPISTIARGILIDDLRRILSVLERPTSTNEAIENAVTVFEYDLERWRDAIREEANGKR